MAKPCPFCGAETNKDYYVIEGNKAAKQCTNCGATGPYIKFPLDTTMKTVQMNARISWNERKEE